jgi:transglutaminase-like putative cysteine protease
MITQRLSYDLRSYADSQTDIFLLDSARSRSLNLPVTGNLQSREFARQLHSTVGSDRDYVFAMLGHFQQNEFFYTLNPALLGEDRIDDFLFSTLEGFCEHYASTFAFLMRAVGIPARVVVGYQGAEYNRFEDYMMVYQYNAHAWNEVWLEGEGWVRFDPTAAVSPERIELGVEAALRDDPAFLDESLFSAMRLGGYSWLNTMRLRLDAVEYEWNRRVVNYDEEVQLELFKRLFGEVTERKVLILLIGLAGIVIIAVGFTVIKIEPASRHDPVTKLYLRVNKELEKVGLGRMQGEGPLSYCDRVTAARPDLVTVMQPLTELYVALSYCPAPATGEQLKQQLKEFKQLLNRLKLNLTPLARMRQRT